MLDLTWYNKNDSRMADEVVPPNYIEDAREYWKDLNEFVDEEGENILNIGANTAIGIPFSSWECNYCQFSKQCLGG